MQDSLLEKIRRLPERHVTGLEQKQRQFFDSRLLQARCEAAVYRRVRHVENGSAFVIENLHAVRISAGMVFVYRPVAGDSADKMARELIGVDVISDNSPVVDVDSFRVRKKRFKGVELARVQNKIRPDDERRGGGYQVCNNEQGEGTNYRAHHARECSTTLKVDRANLAYSPARLCGLVAVSFCSIRAHVSRNETVRLKTRAPGRESRSAQK